MNNTHNITIFGDIEQEAVTQLENCMDDTSIGVLTADGHLGYSHPIGGVVAYRGKISVSGVGYDIGCGNSCLQTNVQARHVDIGDLMRWIQSAISFGMGRTNRIALTDEQYRIVEQIETSPLKQVRDLAQLAATQLGTVGSGNHYVDIFKDEDGWLWIGTHFGSRGFGHKIASGFMALGKGANWGDKTSDNMFDKPIIVAEDSALGADYLHAMQLAGEYARVGRSVVIANILGQLGAYPTKLVNNHHNFAWREQIDGQIYWVVRKGATPNGIGVHSFIGSNMRDDSYIVEGQDTQTNRDALYSTVHGAGRVMSRMKAKGKYKRTKQADGTWLLEEKVKGLVDWTAVQEEVNRRVVLVGGGADEAPQCYKRLADVLGYMGDSVAIRHTLTPIGVAMAGADEFDPYKD